MKKRCSEYELVRTISRADLKQRYQNSKIGFFWSFLNPLLQFSVYYIVFQIILKSNNEENFALRLFLGILLWNFFVESTSNGVTTFISKKSVISKIRIKRLLLPVSVYRTAFINYCLTMVVFICIYLMVMDSYYILTLRSTLVFIISLFIYCFITINITFILAILNVFFRDIQNIWSIILMYGVFLSPIIYVPPVPEYLLPAYYVINPIALPIQLMKTAFFDLYFDQSVFQLIYEPIIVGIVLFVIACILDKKIGAKIPDYL